MTVPQTVCFRLLTRKPKLHLKALSRLGLEIIPFGVLPWDGQLVWYDISPEVADAYILHYRNGERERIGEPVPGKSGKAKSTEFSVSCDTQFPL